MSCAPDAGQLLAELEEAHRRAEQLEQANRKLSSSAADVAHDVRSPLQAIAVFAELLARHGGAGLDETSQHFIANILRAAARIEKVVEAGLEHSFSG